MKRVLFPLILMHLLGCGPVPSFLAPYRGETPEPIIKQAPEEDVFRLEMDLKPENYELKLAIDPRKDVVNGEVKIQIQVGQATQFIRLNALGIEILGARVSGQKNLMVGRWSTNDKGLLAIRFPSKVEAGRAVLELQFRTRLEKTERGIYRLQHDGDWYVFSHLAPVYARRSFPCFDQPDLKAPFAITLTVPSGMTALSNAPEVDRNKDGDTIVYDFARTRPISPHLVGFAVGPFDIRKSLMNNRENVDFRLVTTPGKARLGTHALERVPHVYKSLQSYLDFASPFPKLDLVAVPNFEAGANHGVGLMNFRETLILFDPNHGSPQRGLWVDAALARQVAHTWFGNFVSPAWWSDGWLTESLTTLLAQNTVRALNPKLNSILEAQRLAGIWKLMELDTNAHTQAISQPVNDEEAVLNAQDGVKFLKGATVLAMIESWLGTDVFRSGLKRYLAANPYGSANVEEWSRILDEQTEHPVSQVLQSYMEQPGVPRISMKLDCTAGVAVRLILEQQRALPLQSVASRNQIWQIPICVRYGDTAGGHTECFFTKSRRSEVALPTSRCPTWLHGNKNGVGYYQWSTDAALISRLLDEGIDHLSESERMGLPQLMAISREAGRLSFQEYIHALERLSALADPLMVDGILRRIEHLNGLVTDPETQSLFRGWIRRILGPLQKELEDQTKNAESIQATRRARAYLGRDPAIILEAHTMTEQFIADPSHGFKVDPFDFLPLAARNGDDRLWNGLKSSLDLPLGPFQRIAVISALGAFEDPILFEKSLDLMLHGPLQAQDLAVLGRGIGAQTRGIAWRWLTKNYYAISQGMPIKDRRRLPWVGRGFCSERDLDRIMQFFEEPGHAPPGTAENLGLVLERIQKCIGEQAQIQPSLLEWLHSIKAER